MKKIFFLRSVNMRKILVALILLVVTATIFAGGKPETDMKYGVVRIALAPEYVTQNLKPLNGTGKTAKRYAETALNAIVETDLKKFVNLEPVLQEMLVSPAVFGKRNLSSKEFEKLCKDFGISNSDVHYAKNQARNSSSGYTFQWWYTHENTGVYKTDYDVLQVVFDEDLLGSAIDRVISLSQQSTYN
jgi:hypothetical protein